MSMRKDVLVYVGLLFAALSLAYYSSLPVDKSSEGRVEWLKIEPSSISQVSYESSGRKVEVSKRSDEFYWVKYQNLVNTIDKKADPEPQEFRASKQVLDVLAFFSPMYATRDLGDGKDLDLANFDLEGAGEATITVQATGDIREFKIGKRSYGSRDIYIHDLKSGHVLLLNGSAFDKIKNARGSLYERRLYELTEAEVSRVVVRSAGKEKALEHSSKNSNGITIWSDSEAPATEKPSYKSFVTKVKKINAQTYASSEQRVRLAQSPIFASLEFFKGDESKVTLKFTKDTQGKETTYWVWSSFLDSFVKVDGSRGEGVEKDIPSIVN